MIQSASMCECARSSRAGILTTFESTYAELWAAERRSEEELRSRTSSMAILSCVHLAVSGDDFGLFTTLSLWYFTHFGVCALHLWGLYFLTSFPRQLSFAVRWYHCFSMTSEDNLGSFMICSYSLPVLGLVPCNSGALSLICSSCWPWIVVQILEFTESNNSVFPLG